MSEKAAKRLQRFAAFVDGVNKLGGWAEVRHHAPGVSAEVLMVREDSTSIHPSVRVTRVAQTAKALASLASMIAQYGATGYRVCPLHPSSVPASIIRDWATDFAPR